MNVNEIKQNIISQLPPQPMSQPPMGFTPPAMFPSMMNMYMQRPQIEPYTVPADANAKYDTTQWEDANDAYAEPSVR